MRLPLVRLSLVGDFSSPGRLFEMISKNFTPHSTLCPEISVEHKDLGGFLHEDPGHAGVEEEASEKVVEALHEVVLWPS